jgi:23S rRNA (uridine2552-2'-O)-methyltransferase
VATFFQGLHFWFGALDLPARGQALIAQNAQSLHLGPLAAALAVLQDLEVARAGHPVLVNRFFLLGHWAPKHQQFADVLDRRSVELVGQRLIHQLAGGAVVAEHAYLDESMRTKRSVGFLDDRGCQAVSADHDDGVQMMGVGAVDLALGRGKLNLRHGRIIKAKMKTRTQSKKVNKAWLNDHVNDTYVKLAQKEGYRARAAYKLKEIDEAFGLVIPGHVVVDLGSAPGAWSQYLRRKLSPRTATGGGAAAGELNGTIIALDILPMEPVEGVTFLQGDFRDAEMLNRLEAALTGRRADVVVSDMAPNLSGIPSADAARIAHLVELAVEFAKNQIKPDGTLVVKLFHGGGYDELVKLFKATFRIVKPIKPKASRDKSSETFLVGRGLKSSGES